MACLAGIIAKTQSAPEKKALTNMLESMRHRNELAPCTRQGSSYAVGYALCHHEERWQKAARLSPEYTFWCADGTIMPGSANLLAALDCHGFASGSFGALSDLSGVFVLLCMDEKAGKLYLIMDKYGLKPLFWAEDENNLYFSSEVKGIYAAGFCRRPQASGLYEYLFHGLPLSDRSMHKGVRCLNPGTVLEIDLATGKGCHHVYYVPEVHVNQRLYAQYSQTPEHELIDEFEGLISTSVNNMLDPGVKMGVFLSGGVDSSTITALMAKNHAEIMPWTVEIGDVPGFSERPYAERAAKHLGLELNVFELNAQVFRENLIGTIYALESPLILENAVALYAASAQMKQAGIDLVLDGEGADSLFGGSTNVYKWDLVRYQLQKKLPFIGTYAEKALLLLMRYLAKMGVKVVVPGAETGEGLHFAIGAGGFDHAAIMGHIRELYDFIKNDAEREIHTALLNEFYCYMRPCYQRLTQATMAGGLEVRLPFMDKNVVDFCVNLPLKTKINGSGIRPVTKYLLKKMAERYLPHDLLYRPKMGFGIPGWLYVKNLPEAWFSHGYTAQEYDIPCAYVKKWWHSENSGRDRFLLATLEIWGQLFILGRPPQDVQREFLEANS